MEKCKHCYYNCPCAEEDCDDFTPVGEEYEDLAIENKIEEDRREYRRAWIKYISEF